MNNRLKYLSNVSVIEPHLANNQMSAEQQRDLTLRILEILNKKSTIFNIMRNVIIAIKEETGISCVEIGLKNDEYYPYDTTSVLSEFFTEDITIFEQSFFTDEGSFWSNDIKKFRPNNSIQNIPEKIIEQWRKNNYESVVLIPLKTDNEIFGLLQLIDIRRNLFTKEDVDFLEKLGNSIGIVMARSRMESQLYESANYLENLIGYANAPIIVWDLDYKITIFNRAFELLTQLSAKDVIGQPLSILFPKTDCDSAMEHIKRTSSGHRWDNIEILIQRADKSVRTVLWNSANICDENNEEIVATIAQGHDITERVKVEKMLKEKSSQLHETATYLENLIGYANAPIIVWDLDYKITIFNRAFELLTQRSAKDVIGQPLSILFPKKDCDSAMEHIKRTSSGDRWDNIEILIQRADKGVRTVLWNSANICDENNEEIVATIAQGHDITERVKAENLLKEKSSQLYETNSRLHEGQLALKNKNTTLTELIKHIDREKKDTGEQIRTNIERLINPIISNLEVNASEVHSTYLSLLRTTISEITSPFVSKLEKSRSGLTPREVEICNLIKNGFSSKDIAHTLLTSESTVVTQRKTIRKKLGLSKQKINLANYLQQN